LKLKIARKPDFNVAPADIGRKAKLRR